MPFPFAGAVDTSTKEGVKGYLLARLSVLQNANVGAGDHVKFDTVLAFRGGDITLDTTTAYTNAAGVASIGRFTLKAGKTYKLRGQIPYFLGSGATGLLDYAFLDVTTATEITGNRASLLVATTATNDIGGGFAEAIFTPTQDTLVELRFLTTTAVTSISATAPGRTPTVYIETI